MYYLIEQTLQPTTKKELLASNQPYVAILNCAEWEADKESFPFADDLDDEREEMLTTKADVNYSSLSGTFSIVNRNDLDQDDYRFVFALNEKGIVFLDDSGYVSKAVDCIIHTKKWNSSCLERFLYDFLDHIVKDDLRMMEKYEIELDGLEEKIQNDDKDISISDVNRIRDAMRYLLIHYEQLIDLTQEFEENENGFFSSKNLHYFRSYLTRLDRLYNNASSLRDYTIQIRDFHREQIAVKQNNIMTLLTVITSVFMPLTLITGWYGMNFKYMPELNLQASYPIVFIVCIVIVVICLLYFKKKKWL
ncbi:MAG: hypothetical protein IKS69_03895 [Erysipelotrichaceae bacterium]|nr:hypothetical protein [Erysipelotrichaceae bacterium]